MKKKLIENSFLYTVVLDKDKKKLVLNAPDYYQHHVSKLAVGSKGTIWVSDKKPTRSQNQLRYYFVIVGLLRAYTGDTKDEMHQILVSLCFGTKRKKRFGQWVEIRESVSDAAEMPWGKMAELIDFTLARCAKENVIVPSKESLGYIDNRKPYA